MYGQAAEAKSRIPRNNVRLSGTSALVVAYILSFERAAELLNFGPLLACMGVNAAAFAHYYRRNPGRELTQLFPAISGLRYLSPTLAEFDQASQDCGNTSDDGGNCLWCNENS